MAVVPKTPLVSLPTVLLTVLLASPAVTVEGYGVPGTSQTLKGYDTEGGFDPICWTGLSDLAVLSGAASAADDQLLPSGRHLHHPTDEGEVHDEEEFNGVKATPWDNKLYKSFVLTGEVQLLPECPTDVHVDGDPPVELRDSNEVMRTGRFYDYVVRGSINLDEMAGDLIFSDDGPRIAVQVILCEVGETGFCSPFVHEHANDRLIATNSTKKLSTGDRHGDTHVHAPTVFITLPDASAGGIQSFEVVVPTRVNDPGFFFAIAAFQLLTTTTPIEGEQDALQYKYDVANALSTRLITYQDPPQVLTVTKGMQIIVAILIALSVAALSYVLFQTIKHRENRALKLSQAPFLIVFLISAIVATLCTFLFNPKSDLYCQLHAPLVLIPLQIMYAIIIGRLWRINQVISPILMKKVDMDKKRCSSSASRKFFDFLTSMSRFGQNISCRRKQKKGTRSRSGSLRSTVTDMQLAKVVFAFSLPQIILQILNLTLQPSQVTVDYNIDESIGQTTCETQRTAATSLDMWGWYILILFFILILFLAYDSRTLPSLFNETQEIYNSILISILAIVVGLATIRLSNSPTTSPDVAYLLRVLIVLTMTLNAALRTMLPKIRLAWSGKPILINKLVTDHRIASQASLCGDSSIMTPSYVSMNSGDSLNARYNSQTSARFDSSHHLSSDVSETEHRQIDKTAAAIHHNDLSGSQHRQIDHTATAVAPKVPPKAADVTLKGVDSEVSVDSPTLGTSSSQASQTNGAPQVRFTDEEAQAPLSAPPRRSSKRRHALKTRTIRIDDDHAPSRALILRMMEAQKVLGNVNQEINSGYAVTHDEWANLREACVELGSVFRDDVQFEWEQKEDPGAK